MKTMFKWAGICVVPSIGYFLYLYSDILHASDELKALFFVVHFLSAGAAIYFTLMELKKKVESAPNPEPISVLRFIISGVLTSVTHGLMFGLFTGLYFNVFNTHAKTEYVEQILRPAIIRGMDSTANTEAEYYEHLMAGSDSNVLLPERFAQQKQAALDSLEKSRDLVNKVTYQNLSFSGNMIKWVGFAPFIGILFSVIVVVFIKR